MTAILAPHARPSWALFCWIDDSNIYVELPTTLGQPYITKFPLSEQGLSKALNLLRTRYDEVPSAQRNYTIPAIKPTVTKAGKPAVQTDAQRDHALSILRKMGIV